MFALRSLGYRRNCSRFETKRERSEIHGVSDSDLLQLLAHATTQTQDEVSGIMIVYLDTSMRIDLDTTVCSKACGLLVLWQNLA